MPNSCKCLLDHLLYKSAITVKEYDKILRNLKGVDWIPVTERLPEEEGDYFTTQIDENGKEISSVAYYENEWFTRFEVTAWMPLPEPYEEGAEE